jgi:amino acid transporter
MMTTKHLIAMAWMMGMFFSPEALFLHGKMAGLSGYGFVLPLGVGLVLHWMNGTAAGQDGFTITAPDAEIRLLKDTWGPLAAALLLLMARPVAAVCLATAVLVTSGFVFNEVFLYWFPNFGFAALVLGGLLLVNIIGPQAAAALQLTLASIAIIGLAGISIVGLLAWGQAPHVPQKAALVANSQSVGLALMAFVGYDMLRYTRHGLDQAQLTRVMKTAFIIGGIVFILWNSASLLWVAPSRLAATDIPHVLAAKAMMGPVGRIVIGVVAIAGAGAAVNYLYQSVARMMACMAHHGLLPAIFARSADRPLLALSGLAATTGLLMAAGFAGSDLLDVSIRAGLMLWLVFYALRQIAQSRRTRQTSGSGYALHAARNSARRIIVSAAMITAAAIIGITDDAPILLLKTMSTILALATFLAMGGLLFARGFIATTNMMHAKIKKGEAP